MASGGAGAAGGEREGGVGRSSMTIPTVLTKRFGLRYPVIAAPLGRGATPQFLAALAREGSMGFVALMHMPETEVRQMLSCYIAASGGGDGSRGTMALINHR